jgi:hypothetical protein
MRSIRGCRSTARGTESCRAPARRPDRPAAPPARRPIASFRVRASRLFQKRTTRSAIRSCVW